MKFLLPCAALLSASPALASNWTLDRDASSVRIETTAFGREVTGSFADFGAEIRLDPDDLDNARIEGRVEVASGDTSNPQYNSEMTGNSGLDADNHPLATFVSETVTTSDACPAGESDCYAASGILTLAGNARPADLLFRLVIVDERAAADGVIIVNREEYGIGSGNWGGAAETVTVRLHIEATR
ncbi:MAG: hypothetical protein GC188_08050 [Alphaproteobacteria bacterium]|nr:hypothetical protein [Alphaproteobacteria bacterium]